MGRKRSVIKHEEKSTQNNPRLYFYRQILISQPKIFNINQKNDFKHQNRTLLKRNIKDTVLSAEWMK